MVKFPVRVTYAGRLDKDSEGLLLLTNDGDLIQHMMRGSEGHEKEYVVKVNKEITEEFLEKMRNGVHLSELHLTTKPCKVEQLGKFTFNKNALRFYAAGGSVCFSRLRQLLQ